MFWEKIIVKIIIINKYFEEEAGLTYKENTF